MIANFRYLSEVYSSNETTQIKNMVGEIIDEKVAPLVQGVISQAGGEFGSLVVKTSGWL